MMATQLTTVTLYEIQDDLLACLNTVEMLDAPEDAELREELETRIAALITAEIRKVDGITRVMAHLESQADLATLEIKRLQARKHAIEAHSARLEACIRRAMELAGKTVLEGSTSTLQLKKNPPAVFLRDVAAVPAEFKTTTITYGVDKDGIKRAIKAGGDVPGAELVQGDRLVRS